MKLIKLLDDVDGLPAGRVLTVDAGGAEGTVTSELALELIEAKLATPALCVIFDKPSGPYNAGDLATFEAKQAEILLGAGIVHIKS